jgi:hypothetical protein
LQSFVLRDRKLVAAAHHGYLVWPNGISKPTTLALAKPHDVFASLKQTLVVEDLRVLNFIKDNATMMVAIEVPQRRQVRIQALAVHKQSVLFAKQGFRKCGFACHGLASQDQNLEPPCHTILGRCVLQFPVLDHIVFDESMSKGRKRARNNQPLAFPFLLVLKLLNVPDIVDEVLDTVATRQT